MSSITRTPKLPDGHLLNPNIRLDPGKPNAEQPNPKIAMECPEGTRQPADMQRTAEKKMQTTHATGALKPLPFREGIFIDALMIAFACLPLLLSVGLVILIVYSYLDAPPPDIAVPQTSIEQSSTTLHSQAPD